MFARAEINIRHYEKSEKATPRDVLINLKICNHLIFYSIVNLYIGLLPISFGISVKVLSFIEKKNKSPSYTPFDHYLTISRYKKKINNFLDYLHGNGVLMCFNYKYFTCVFCIIWNVSQYGLRNFYLNQAHICENFHIFSIL